MKMNNRGAVGTVFRFSLAQHYKTTSVRIFLLFLALVGFFSVPLLKMIYAKGAEVDTTAVTQLFVRNDTEFPFDPAAFTSDERYQNVELTMTDQSDEELSNLLAEKTTSAALVIAQNELGLQLNVLYSEKSALESADLHTVGTVAETALHQSLLDSLSVEPGQLDVLNMKTFSQVQMLSAYDSTDEEANVDTHYFMNFAYSYFVLILATISMSYIFSLCIEEKNTKLIEYLLVSVQPTALLFGKILAVTVFVTAGIGLLIGTAVISYFVAKSQGSVTFIHDALKAMGIWDVLHSIHAQDLILTIVGVVLGYFMLSLISGILGSLCSKNEDTQQASLGLVFIILIGYMAASFSPLFESDAMNLILSLFPLTSIFVAPANYVCGKITLPILLLAFVLQALTICYLVKLLGRVYRMMVLYRGQVPTPSRLIKMLRETRKTEKGGDSHEA